MRYMRILKTAILVVALGALGFGCKKKNFKVVQFCRSDTENCSAKEDCFAGMDAKVEAAKRLASEGFEYVGPLNNNGINCTSVLFGK